MATALSRNQFEIEAREPAPSSQAQDGEELLMGRRRRSRRLLLLVAVLFLAIVGGIVGLIVSRFSNGSKDVAPNAPTTDGGDSQPPAADSRPSATDTQEDRHGDSPLGCSEEYKASTRVSVTPTPAPAATKRFDGSESPPDISDPDIGVAGVKAWARARTKKAEIEFQGSRLSSPDNWASSIVYNIQVDRFLNGDVSNDASNIQELQRQSLKDGVYKADMRHGGDLEGVRRRLPYLKDLGVNVVWMTPFLEHDGSYHGYCTSSLTDVDPGFGTNDLFRRVVKEAHDLQIRVVLDVVANHMCEREGEGESTKYEPVRQPGDSIVSKCADALEKKHWAGEDGGVSSQARMVFSKQFFPPFRRGEFFNRCGPNTGETMTGSDPITVYGDFAATMFDYNTRNRDFQEVFTELMKYWIAYADVDGYRIDAAKHVTEDFLAYLSTETRQYAESIGKANFYIIGEVAATVEWQARRLGMMASDPDDPNKHDRQLGMPKEVTKALVNLKQTYQKHKKFPFPGLGAVYNFYQSGKAKAALVGWDDLGNKAYVGTLGWYLEDGKKEMSSVMGQMQDCCGKQESGCTLQLNQMWTLLEIHDWPRFASFFPKELRFPKAGFAWLFTGPGQPVVHYGAEQGFNSQCPDAAEMKAGGGIDDILNVCRAMENDRFGHGGDMSSRHPFYRQDMFSGGPFRLGSAVSEIDSHKGISIDKLLNPEQPPDNWLDDAFLRTDHDLYRFVRRLAKLRSTCRVLSTGRTKWGVPGPDTRPPRSLLLFSRYSKTDEIVVVINPNSEQAEQFQFPCTAAYNKADDIYRDVLDADPFRTFRVQLRDGGCHLNPEKYEEGHVDPFKVRILVKEDLLEKKDGKVFYDDAYSSTAFCKTPDTITMV